MKKPAYISLLVIMVLLTGACRKITRNTEVHGTVRDARTESIIPNAHVYLSGKVESAMGSGYSTIAEAITGADGAFSFEFKAERDYMYAVSATAYNYSGGFTVIDKFKNNKNETISLDPHAWVRLHVKNTSPFDSNDFINIVNFDPAFGFYGTTVDTVVVGRVHGGMNWNFQWYTTKNGVNTSSAATVFSPIFDTVNYDLNY